MKKKNGIFNNPILRTIYQIFSWLILGILVIAAVFLIYYFISSKVYASKGQKYEPRFSLYTIISASMEPNINIYDVVFTSKVDDPSTLKEGDIITFISTSTLSEGATVTHRIKNVVKTENGYKFRTQGDNNPVADSSLVDSENILGKVIFKSPQVGRLQFLLQTKGGWLIVLLIPAMLIVVFDIGKVIRLSNTKQVLEETLVKSEEERKNKEKEQKEKEAKLKKELQDKFKTKRNKIKEIEEEEEEENIKLPKIKKK